MTDPYFSGREMAEGTTDAETIFNEHVARVHASFGRLESRTTTTPPGLPAKFEAYLVPTGGTGAWNGLDGNIVIWLDDWLVMPIKSGMSVFIVDEGKVVEFLNDGGTVADATLGAQLITPVFVSGAWRIQNWDVSKGPIGHAVLSNPTIIMPPVNMQPGRRYVLRLEQDGTGGRTATLDTGSWASVGGLVLLDIDTTALRVTDVVIQGPSESLDVPAVHATVKDLRVTTP